MRTYRRGRMKLPKRPGTHSKMYAWESIKKALNSQRDSVMESLIKRYKEFRCNTSLKIHFLHPHLSSSENAGDVSDNQ